MSGQIAVCIWEAGSFYERDMAAMSPQQRAKMGRQTQRNSPSEKWQEAREKKQSVNQVRKRRESQTRGGKAKGIMLKGKEAFKENRRDQHLFFVLLGLNLTNKIHQY